jgi:hypothetical protein
MTDRFQSYARAPGAPYTQAVGLVASDEEFEATAAIYVNSPCVAKVRFSDSAEVVTLVLDSIGEYKFRIAALTEISGPSMSASVFPSGSWPVHRIVGLY